MRTDSGSNIPPSASTGSSSTHPRTWAIASGKGGVGKSLLTANLGCLLAESNWPTLLLDLDLQGANLHTFLGVPASMGGLGSFVKGKGLKSAIFSHDVPGLSYIPGCSVAGVEANDILKGQVFSENGQNGEHPLLAQLQELDEKEVILDLPTGHETWVLDLFAQVDVPVLVITPDPPSVENAHGFLRRAWWQGIKRYLSSLDDKSMSPSHLISLACAELGENVRPELFLRWLTGKMGLSLTEAQTPASFFGSVPHLLVNQVNGQNDADMGFFFVRAVQDYFSMTMPLIGTVQYDQGVRLTTRRRRLHLREPSEQCLSEGLSQVADHIVEGGSLRPTHM